MTAIDHLAGKEGNTVALLQELTDEQLRDQLDYFRQRSDTATTTGEGVYRSEGYARFRHDTHAGMVESVMLSRGLSLDHDSSSSGS